MRCDDCASYSKFSSIEASFFSFFVRVFGLADDDGDDDDSRS